MKNKLQALRKAVEVGNATVDEKKHQLNLLDELLSLLEAEELKKEEHSKKKKSSKWF